MFLHALLDGLEARLGRAAECRSACRIPRNAAKKVYVPFIAEDVQSLSDLRASCP